MEIQFITPSPAISATTTPYVTAPSTPHRFPSFFYSAPTSPTHAVAVDDEDDDFAFDFSGQLQPPSISAADELFHCGKIKPLKPVIDDPSKPPTTRLKQAFAKKNLDSFADQVLNQTPSNHNQTTQNPPKRGRETTTTTTRATARIREKVSRSASPFRISDILSDDEDNNDKTSPTWYNKWNLKNLLLFRSASEGSGRKIERKSKNPVNKYSRINKLADEDVKNSSFRSTDSCGSVVGSSRRVMRKVSAHEIHYTANRAVAEEMRRKTYLPYKSGLLGCLRFHNNGAGAGAGCGRVHEISRGITSVMKQRGA